VPMRILTLPLVIAEVVSRGKRVFYGDFEHFVLTLEMASFIVSRCCPAKA
jgi:hypothetical protein